MATTRKLYKWNSRFGWFSAATVALLVRVYGVKSHFRNISTHTTTRRKAGRWPNLT
jgi:hypothetical protein